MKTQSAKVWVGLLSVILTGVAHASVLRFHANLSGANEVPANTSTATGFADVYYDSDAHTLQVNITFAGLTSGTTAAHIHAPGTAATIASAIPFNGTWAVATQPTNFTAFPLGVTSGSYVGAAYSLTSTANYTAGFVAANGTTGPSSEAALVSYLLAGKTYLNVHSTINAGGEIKGYLQYVAATGAAKLINVSARAQVGTGDSAFIIGFVVEGLAPRTVLIRAVGPTLTDYAVSGVLADPQLDVTQNVGGTAVVVGSNDNWGGIAQISAAASSVGAFPLNNIASKDAAILITLAPGLYSAKATGVGGTTGNALVEVYEVP
ncbi:MAG: putative esterase [Lacunisphaera sp.]|nr:putative esterase [Lacunisphaera sp.]